MAHYAKVENGVVTQVIVADPEVISGMDGQWVKTSYNMRGGVYLDSLTRLPVDDQTIISGDDARERKNFASIGFTYDSSADAFIPPQPYSSWVLNTSTCIWDAPIALPSDSGTGDPKILYYWDEDAYQNDSGNPKTVGWVRLP